MNKREWMLQAALCCANEAVTTGQEAQWAQGLSQLYDAICAATPETLEEGAWVEHDGDVSKAPPEYAEVEVQFRGGAVGRGHGGDYAWDHDGDDGDIVRWRYV